MSHQQLQEEFIRALDRFRKFQFCDLMSHLTKGEFFTLFMIHAHSAAHPKRKGMYVSELAGTLRVTSPAVSRMLRTLEQRGLIERTVDRDDRRTTYIVLTPVGETARRNAAHRMHDFTERVVEQMGERDMETFLALFHRLSDVMSDEFENLASKGDQTC